MEKRPPRLFAYQPELAPENVDAWLHFRVGDRAGMSMPVHTKTRRRLAALFSVPLAFSLVFFFVNQAADHQETHLLQVQHLSRSLVELRAHARDLEAGERGYYLTGQERFLSPFVQAQLTMGPLIRQSRASAQEQPEYRSRVDRVIRLVEIRLAEASQGVALKRHGLGSGTEFAHRLIQSEDTMDTIRVNIESLLAGLNRDEIRILDSRHTFSRWSFFFFSAGSLVMIGVIVWLYNVLLRYLYERDVANENLKIANTHLEARIEERTRDLTNANEELQQFAYVASHDLQEPLRTITSFSQLLAVRYRGKLDADADEFIGYITGASRRMTDLINGLLALARLRKSGQPTAPVPFGSLVAQAEMSLQAAIRESGATLELGPLPSLVVDSVQFAQVFQNLISNAIKYRRSEVPFIRIEARQEAGSWVFSVEDNGRGFDPQFSERIFGLFQRLNNREEGTGMGLSIARKIVERHGGRMWAKSNSGAGSTFFFSLPVSLEGGRATSTEEQPAAVSRM